MGSTLFCGKKGAGRQQEDKMHPLTSIGSRVGKLKAREVQTGAISLHRDSIGVAPAQDTMAERTKTRL